MNDPELNSTTARRRKFWRLHRSTCAFVLLAAIPWMLIAVPGSRYNCNYRKPVFEYTHHGWPAIHAVQIHNVSEFSQSELEAIVDFRHGIVYRLFKTDELEWISDTFWADRFGNVATKRYWSKPENWSYFSASSHWAWNLKALALNASLFLGYLFVLAISFEWLRRRKQSWYHLTILEGLIAIAAVAGIAAWVTNSMHQVKKRTNAFGELAKHADIFAISVDEETPVWLDRLSDGAFDRIARSQWCYQHFDDSNLPKIDDSNGRLPVFAHFGYVQIGGIQDGKKVADCVNSISPLGIHLNFSADNDQQAVFLEHLNPEITELLVIPDHRLPSGVDPIWSRELKSLHRFTNLDWISLNGCKFEPGVVHQWPDTRHLTLDEGCEDPHGVFKDWMRQTKRMNSISGGPVLIHVLDDVPARTESITLELTNEGAPYNLGPLTKLAKLESLDINSQIDGPISLADLGFEFHRFPEVTWVQLKFVEWDEQTLNWLASLPKLSSLRLRIHEFSDEQKAELESRLPEVEILYF